jgi:hypothetical protein
MMKNEKKARSVLDRFYETIYNIPYETPDSDSPLATRINAVAVSDCAVLFLSSGSEESNRDVDKIEGLPKLLKFIKKTNRALVRKSFGFPFMTTCSIAYGDFEYRNKSDREYVRKNCIMGTAYVRALLDSESSESKMRPGECRILKDNLDLLPSQNPVFQLLDSRKTYYYFYWMLENPQDIRRFKRKYRKIWEGTYSRLIKLLQNPASRTSIRNNRSSSF